MAKHQTKGVFKQLVGDVKRSLGKATGDRPTQADGAAKSVAGRAQAGFGQVKSKAKRTLKR